MNDDDVKQGPKPQHLQATHTVLKSLFDYSPKKCFGFGQVVTVQSNEAQIMLQVA